MTALIGDNEDMINHSRSIYYNNVVIEDASNQTCKFIPKTHKQKTIRLNQYLDDDKEFLKEN